MLMVHSAICSGGFDERSEVHRYAALVRNRKVADKGSEDGLLCAHIGSSGMAEQADKQIRSPCLIDG